MDREPARTLRELNFYCYCKLREDELGLTHLEDIDVVSKSSYTPYYNALDVESELLYRPLDDIHVLRSDWPKAKADHEKYSRSFLNEMNDDDVSWIGVVCMVTATKMFIRRYRETNPLFASMFCVEMLGMMNEMGESAFFSWRTEAEKYTKPKTRKNMIMTDTHEAIQCFECWATTLMFVAVGVGVWHWIL